MLFGWKARFNSADGSAIVKGNNFESLARLPTEVVYQSRKSRSITVAVIDVFCDACRLICH